MAKNSSRRIPPAAALAVGGGLLLISIFLSLSVGASSFSVVRMISDIVSGGESSAANIFLLIRLPRTLACLLAGAALALAGAIIQQVLGNPLAGPNIIGVNAGAGFAAILCMAFLPQHPSMVTFAAFLGALLATLVVYFIASRTGASRITLVLAGVAINAFLNAGTDTINVLYPDALVSSTTFKIGGFAGVTMSSLYPAVIYIVASAVAALLLHNVIDVMSLGDDTAKSLGVNAPLMRFVLLMLAAALAGAAVSFAGLLGFVGLIIPHAIRLSIGSQSHHLIPASLLYGSSFVLLCDSISRVLFAPYEIPVGILMAFIGGPFFLWMLIKNKGGRQND